MKSGLHFTHKRKKMALPSMAPLVDIVFQLLIFFMLSSALAVQDRLDVELPKAEAGKNATNEAITVLVNLKGEFAVNNVVTPRDELLEALKDSLASGYGTALMIKADAGTRTAEVVHVFQEARKAGIRNVKIATQLTPTR
jgi:biopolymer transport protein ExbD